MKEQELIFNALEKIAEWLDENKFSELILDYTTCSYGRFEERAIFDLVNNEYYFQIRVKEGSEFRYNKYPFILSSSEKELFKNDQDFLYVAKKFINKWPTYKEYFTNRKRKLIAATEAEKEYLRNFEA